MKIDNIINNNSLLENSTIEKLTLGKLIWAIRQSKGKSQVDMAKTLGISKQHLCDIEHDRKSISPKLAAKYANTLNHPSSEFIQLALQGMIDRDNLNVIVNVTVKQDASSTATPEEH